MRSIRWLSLVFTVLVVVDSVLAGGGGVPPVVLAAPRACSSGPVGATLTPPITPIVRAGGP
jgi:hypothetical protein